MYVGRGLPITWINELLRYVTLCTFCFYCRNVDVFRTFGIGPICKEERLSRVYEKQSGRSHPDPGPCHL